MHGVYCNTRSLLSTSRSTYNPVTRASEADVLGEIIQAELLVLDDLVAERPTEWVGEMMHRVYVRPHGGRRTGPCGNKATTRW